MRRAHLGSGEGLETVPVAAVALVGLELLPTPRQLGLRGIRHDDERARVDGRIESREILRPEFVGDDDGETADRLVIRVDEEPRTLVARIRSTVALLHLSFSFLSCGFVPFAQGFARG